MRVTPDGVCIRFERQELLIQHSMLHGIDLLTLKRHLNNVNER